jgi:hypothetical protein
VGFGIAGHAMSFLSAAQRGTRLDIFYRLRREDGIGCLPNGRIIYYHAHTPRGMGRGGRGKKKKVEKVDFIELCQEKNEKNTVTTRHNSCKTWFWTIIISVNSHDNEEILDTMFSGLLPDCEGWW